MIKIKNMVKQLFCKYQKIVPTLSDRHVEQDNPAKVTIQQ